MTREKCSVIARISPAILLALCTGIAFDFTLSPPVQADNKAVAQKDVDFGPYMAKLQRQIKRAWFPPRGTESKRVVVVFKLSSEGKASDIRISQSAGSKVADDAAINAVEKAAPFDSLPAGAPSTVDIQFTYDYNVFSKQNAAKSADPRTHLLDQLKRAEASGNRTEIISSLVALADNEASQKMNTQAMEHYKHAIALMHKSNPQSEGYLAVQLTALGDLYYDNDDYENCKPVYEEVLNIRLKDAKSTDSQLGEARRDMGYTLLYLDDGDVGKAKKLFDEALADALKDGDEELQIDVQQGIAHCHWKNSEYAKALPLYELVLNYKRSKQPDDYLDLGYRSKDVADCYYELHRYRESLPLFKDAQSYLEKAGKTDDDELVDAREKVTELNSRLGLPKEQVAQAVDEQKQKSIDKAFAWLPYALGGCLLALLVIAIGNMKNNSVDIAGRNRNS